MSKSLTEWCKRHIQEIKDNEIQTGLIESKGNSLRISQLEDRKRKYRQMLGDGQITTPEYEADIKDINAELELLNNPKSRNQDWHKIAESIVDLTTEIITTLQEGTILEKRSMFTRLGSNLIWNEEILSIINSEPVQKLIDGLNEAKSKNPQFEPESIVDTSDQNEVFENVRPIMLAWESAFRTYDWMKAVGDLETTTKEINHLLSLVSE